MKFYINEYKGKFAMHCKTEEEAIDFCNFLHSIGRTWNNGESYKHINNFNDLEKNTVYVFNEGTYSSLIYVKTVGYKILEWEDFMEKKFTKADLKDGMVVEFYDTTRRMIIGDNISGYSTFVKLGDFTNTLEHKKFRELTIDKVYKSTATTLNNCFADKYLTLIWERPKEEPIKEMTIAEVEKILGHKVKIVNGENI